MSVVIAIVYESITNIRFHEAHSDSLNQEGRMSLKGLYNGLINSISRNIL